MRVSILFFLSSLRAPRGDVVENALLGEAILVREEGGGWAIERLRRDCRRGLIMERTGPWMGGILEVREGVQGWEVDGIATLSFMVEAGEISRNLVHVT